MYATASLKINLGLSQNFGFWEITGGGSLPPHSSLAALSVEFCFAKLLKDLTP
jgi:hypothetical protein